MDDHIEHAGKDPATILDFGSILSLLTIIRQIYFPDSSVAL